MSYYDQKSLPPYSNVPNMTPQTLSPALMGGVQQVSYGSPMQSQLVPHQPMMQQQIQPMQQQQEQQMQPMMPQQMSQVGMMPVTYAQQPTISATYTGPLPISNRFDDMCSEGHSYKTEYGMCGIITALALFPIGLIALVIDKDTVCRRCSHKK